MNSTSAPATPVSSRLLFEFERLLETNFGLQTMRGTAHPTLNEWSPTADIHETDEALSFAVELPGIAPDQVQVTAEENVLTVRATRSPRHEGKLGARFHLIERHDGTFVRHFQLPRQRQRVDDHRRVCKRIARAPHTEGGAPAGDGDQGEDHSGSCRERIGCDAARRGSRRAETRGVDSERLEQDSPCWGILVASRDSGRPVPRPVRPAPTLLSSRRFNAANTQ